MKSESMLFVSPVVPSLTGNGLAMRAARTLFAFSRRYRVTLLVLARYGSPAGFSVPSDLGAVCESAFVVPIFARKQSGGLPGERKVRHALADEHFDIVHIFRLDTVRHAKRWIPGVVSEFWLDLDDVESVTHRGIAELHRKLGDEQNAAIEFGLASLNELAEIDALRTFDRVFLASPLDIERLPLFGPARMEVLPNVLPIPGPIQVGSETGPFTFLFVGTLGYFPNWEGISWLIRDVWPIVCQRANRPVEFHIVGNGASRELNWCAMEPGVRLIGPVENVKGAYENANAIVVPLRAGGGTRIKVIEAFGFCRPVITTSIGVEGIDAIPDREVIVADDADSFADGMLRLIDDARLRDILVSNAYQLALDRYTENQLEAIVQHL